MPKTYKIFLLSTLLLSICSLLGSSCEQADRIQEKIISNLKSTKQVDQLNGQIENKTLFYPERALAYIEESLGLSYRPQAQKTFLSKALKIVKKALTFANLQTTKSL